jgi:hypothetical protein
MTSKLTFLFILPGRGREILSLRHRVQTGSGAHPLSYQMGTGGSFAGNKAAESGHFPPSRAEVNNTCCYTSTPPYEGVSKSFRTQSITKYTLTKINTCWEAIQRVMAEKLSRLTHKIAIKLHLVAESCTIRSSRYRRPVRKLLDTHWYVVMASYLLSTVTTSLLPVYNSRAAIKSVTNMRAV